MNRCLYDLCAGLAQPFEALVEALEPTLPLLSQLADTRQDPTWHAEGDVAAHTAMVLERLEQLPQLAQLSAEQSLALRLAALLHDIAKPLVTRSRGAPGYERLVAPGHAERAAAYLGCRLPALAAVFGEAALFLAIALVRQHHDPIRLVRKNQPASAVRGLWRASDPQLLGLLARADMLGRRCDDQTEQLELVELYELLVQEQLAEVASSGTSHRAIVVEVASDLGARGIDDAETIEQAAMDGVFDWEAGRIHAPQEATARFLARRQQTPEKPAQLLLTCGPSGSGKSSWVAKNQGSIDRLISLDDLRVEIAGRRESQRHNAEVLKAARQQLRQALRHGQRVVWDATSLRRDHRTGVLQTAREYGAHTTLAVFCTPPSVLRERNSQREFAVPANALERQLEIFEWPGDSEAHRLVLLDAQGRALRDSRSWWQQRISAALAVS